MDQDMKKRAAAKKSTATPKKGGAATPDCKFLDRSLPFIFSDADIDTAVKSGRVTKRAPKTPSKLKRVDSDDEDEEMGGTTAAVKEEEEA